MRLSQRFQPIKDVDAEAVGVLLRTWRERLGADPVHVRQVLDLALERPELYRALTTLVPELVDYPQPDVLRAWLYGVENRPLSLGSDRWRLSRSGHRWSLRAVDAVQALDRPALVA